MVYGKRHNKDLRLRIDALFRQVQTRLKEHLASTARDDVIAPASTPTRPERKSLPLRVPPAAAPSESARSSGAAPPPAARTSSETPARPSAWLRGDVHLLLYVGLPHAVLVLSLACLLLRLLLHTLAALRWRHSRAAGDESCSSRPLPALSERLAQRSPLLLWLPGEGLCMLGVAAGEAHWRSR